MVRNPPVRGGLCVQLTQIGFQFHLWTLSKDQNSEDPPLRGGLCVELTQNRCPSGRVFSIWRLSKNFSNVHFFVPMLKTAGSSVVYSNPGMFGTILGRRDDF